MFDENENLFVNSGFFDDENENEDVPNERSYGKLLSDIAAMDGKKKLKPQRSEPNTKISEFNLSETGREKVKVYELLASLKKDIRNQDLKSQIKSASRKTKILPTPLPKPEAERIKRGVAYTKVEKEVQKWDVVVQSNREADHLEFPLKQSSVEIGPTTSFIKNFRPKTPLEIEIAQMLSTSDNVFHEDKQLTLAEEKALKAMDVEEARERLGELRKVRALLSFQEAKARRQKKIKSKKFHRILKKERLKNDLKAFEELRQVDPALAAEKFQSLDKIRIQERMTLRHKSTGKWAKQRQIRAKYDKESRDALSVQLDFSRQLTEKVKVSGSEPESSEDDEPIEQLDPLENNSNAKPMLEKPLSKTYNPWLKDSTTGQNKSQKRPLNQTPTLSKSSKIARKEMKVRFDPALDKLEEDHEFELSDNETDETVRKNPKSSKVKSETNKLVKKGAKTDENVLTAKKNKKITKKLKKAKKPKVNKKVTVVLADLTGAKNDSEDEIEEFDEMGESLVKRNKMEDFEDLELLISNPRPKAKLDTSDETQKANAKKDSEIQIDPKKFVMVKTKTLNSQIPVLMEQGEDGSDDDDEEYRMTIAEAFADDNVIEEFSQEKQKIINENAPKAVDLSLPGWGSWGGTGIVLSEERRARFIVPAAPAAPRLDRDFGHVIINEKGNEKLKQHQVHIVPFPFKRIGQFEQSIKHPIGSTWNPQTSFKEMIVPPITTKRGQIIDPIDGEAIILKQKLQRGTKANNLGNIEKMNF